MCEGGLQREMKMYALYQSIQSGKISDTYHNCIVLVAIGTSKLEIVVFVVGVISYCPRLICLFADVAIVSRYPLSLSLSLCVCVCVCYYNVAIKVKVIYGGVLCSDQWTLTNRYIPEVNHT